MNSRYLDRIHRTRPILSGQGDNSHMSLNLVKISWMECQMRTKLERRRKKRSESQILAILGGNAQRWVRVLMTIVNSVLALSI
jgi:hypothetical protein